jgi:aminoglycoside 6-adenylyltransferase
MPGAQVDAYSDYDVVVVVDDVRAMRDDTGWQDHFGEVLISYWDPVERNPSTGAEWVGNITNYASGLKIDFSLWSPQHYADVTAGPDPCAEFDAGYRVVVDKDGLTTQLPAPTFGSYIPARPDEATYLRLITDFLIGVPYVAKSLLRGQLLPAKWVLDCDMRFNYLVPLLEWRVECDHDWSLKTGNLGKGLETHLPADTRRGLERTFTGADPVANWEALFEMIALFDRVAREVADLLGYAHPRDLIRRVTDHAQRMREGVFAGGPLDAE